MSRLGVMQCWGNAGRYRVQCQGDLLDGGTSKTGEGVLSRRKQDVFSPSFSRLKGGRTIMHTLLLTSGICARPLSSSRARYWQPQAPARAERLGPDHRADAMSARR